MKRARLLLRLGWMALPACSESAPPAFTPPPSPVVVAAAEQQDVSLYLDEIGKCVALEVVSVRPQVSGRITQVHFADGADLKMGDQLFTIDARPFQASFDAAQGRLAQASAALDLARQELVRLENLTEPRAVSQRDLDVRKNAVTVAEAQVQSSEAAVETAKLDLEYTSIRSPIDGRAGHRLVDAGNFVDVMDHPVLLVIQRLDPIYADFAVSEHDLTEVQRSMEKGSLQVEASLPDEASPPAVGELTFLDNAVQEGTGTVKLRALLPNADHRFWPGRFLEVRLRLSILEDVVLVPAKAPQMSAQGPFVYLVKDDSTTELRPVTLGQRHGELVVISSGLAPGDRVVVEGHLGVMPGGKVRVVEPGPPPGAGPSPQTKTAGAGS
jgi:membrane fusion protein, multidrug efflux system